jgi:hypothetical protein
MPAPISVCALPSFVSRTGPALPAQLRLRSGPGDPVPQAVAIRRQPPPDIIINWPQSDADPTQREEARAARERAQARHAGGH